MCQFACFFYTCGHRRFVIDHFCQSYMLSGKRCASTPDEVNNADVVRRVYKALRCTNCRPIADDSDNNGNNNNANTVDEMNTILMA